MVNPVYAGPDENGHPEFLGDEWFPDDLEITEMYDHFHTSHVNYSPHLCYNVDISSLARMYEHIVAILDRMTGYRARELAEAYRRLTKELKRDKTEPHSLLGLPHPGGSRHPEL